jgi:rubrerythrin
MALNFNAREIFEMGVQIERNGKAFYEAASKKASNADVRELFKELAAWESGHITLFEKMRDELPANSGAADVFDPEGDAHLYLHAAADSHVFLKNKNMESLAEKCKDALAALDMGVTFEKDSVVFYTTMKKAVPPNLGKATIERIIEEEIKHIGMLIDKEKQLVTRKKS